MILNKREKAWIKYNKLSKSNERTTTSYLMSKTADELVGDKKYDKFVQDCIAEHGYSWQYNLSKNLHFSKRKSLLYKKRKK